MSAILLNSESCRAIDSAAESATDIPGQAYWWSNCIQLRWMLWAVCHGGQLDPEPEDEDSDEFEWVMQVCLLYTLLSTCFTPSLNK